MNKETLQNYNTRLSDNNDSLNSVLSMINDLPQVEESEGGKEMVNYSTEEQIIGTWIDGRDLYRKVLLTGGLKNNDTTYVPYNIENLDRIVSLKGIAYNGQFGLMLPCSHQTASSTINVYVDYSQGNIGIQTFSDRTSYTVGYLIIEYIKL